MRAIQRAASRQLSLALIVPWPDDGFRFTWHNTQIGAAVWAEYRGSWRPGSVTHRGRTNVTVTLTDRSGRTHHLKRRYGDLRRRPIKPRLAVVREAK
jgi:hypothetical protein